MGFSDSPDSLPLSLTIRHFHVFDASVGKGELKNEKLDSPESWDLLRTKDPLFSIASDREQWVAASEGTVKKDGQDARLKERSGEVAAILKEKGITTLFSVGSGGAGLEYQILKAMPPLHVICSEYAPQSVALLAHVFTEAEAVIPFDLKKGDWAPLMGRPDAATSLCLMYRLDAQFTDAEWKAVFAGLERAGVRQVLYIPTGFLTLHSILARLKMRLRWWFAKKSMIFSGYLRTKQTFASYWKGRYRATEYRLAGMTGFWLELV